MGAADLEGGCELALVLDVSQGRISRFMVIEDLPSFIRGGGSLIEASVPDLFPVKDGLPSQQCAHNPDPVDLTYRYVEDVPVQHDQIRHFAHLD